MRKYPIVEIEDMAEPFCGVRRSGSISAEVVLSSAMQNEKIDGRA
jgi:hypothetical protein